MDNHFKFNVLMSAFNRDVNFGDPMRTYLYLDGKCIGKCESIEQFQLSSGTEAAYMVFVIFGYADVNAAKLQSMYSDEDAFDIKLNYDPPSNGYILYLATKEEESEVVGARAIGKSRISKTQYYLNIAKAVSERSTCLRRRYGAVIVRNDRLVATGYNGAARGCENCCDAGVCARKDIPHGTRYELCKAVHAEQNAIMQAGTELTAGSVLYLAGVDAETGETLHDIDCCMMCKRAVINAGIEKVVFADGDTGWKVSDVIDWRE